MHPLTTEDRRSIGEAADAVLTLGSCLSRLTALDVRLFVSSKVYPQFPPLLFSIRGIAKAVALCRRNKIG